MKQHKIWQIGLIAAFLLGNTATAQENRVDFTFKVKKKTEISPSPAIKSEEKVDKKAEKENLEQLIISKPKLIGGEFGLLKIENCDSSQHQRRKNSYKYVIFSYVVGKNGKVKDIIFEQANDLELKNVLYQSLLAADWRPAKNGQKQTCDFLYTNQILIAPLNFLNYEDIGH